MLELHIARGGKKHTHALSSDDHAVLQVWHPTITVKILCAHRNYEGLFAGSELFDTDQSIIQTHLWKLGSLLQQGSH